MALHLAAPQTPPTPGRQADQQPRAAYQSCPLGCNNPIFWALILPNSQDESQAEKPIGKMGPLLQTLRISKVS